MSADDTDPAPFVEVRFAGDRFDLEYLPVDVASTLEAYQNLILEIAKDIWRSANPNRPRLPRSFNSAFKLGIGAIKPTGSKTARLPRLHEYQSPLFSEDFMDDVFLNAQERLASIVNAANRTGEPRPVPETVIRQLHLVRRNLLNDEVLEITPTGEGRSRTNSFRISERTIDTIEEVSRFRRETKLSGLGIVVGTDESPPSVKVVTPNGTVRFAVEWEKLRKQLSIGTSVYLTLFAEVDRADTIKSIIDYTSLEPISDEPLAVRLQERIDQLAIDASEDRDGLRVSSETTIRAKELCTYLGRRYSRISVFLTNDAGIQFEWTHDDAIINLAVMGRKLTLGASDLKSSKYNEISHPSVTSALLSDLENIRRFIDEGLES